MRTNSFVHRATIAFFLGVIVLLGFPVVASAQTPGAAGWTRGATEFGNQFPCVNQSGTTCVVDIAWTSNVNACLVLRQTGQLASCSGPSAVDVIYTSSSFITDAGYDFDVYEVDAGFTPIGPRLSTIHAYKMSPSCEWVGPIDYSTSYGSMSPSMGTIIYPYEGQYGTFILHPGGANYCRNLWDGSVLGTWFAPLGGWGERMGAFTLACTGLPWCEPSPPNGHWKRQYECWSGLTPFPSGSYARSNICEVYTQPPPPPPPPTATMVATSPVVYGGATIYEWTSSNASYCAFYINGAWVGDTNNGWPFNSPPGGWGYTISKDTTFQIQCQNPSGTWVSASALVKALPLGIIDSVSSGVSCGRVAGWAFDGDKTDNSIAVHLYLDGPAGSPPPTVGYNIGPTLVQRDGVNSAYGITGLHGYDYQITPQPGYGSHTIYAYGIGVNSVPAQDGFNSLLTNSPTTFSCLSPAPATLTATCPGGTTVTMNWSAAPGATYYAPRIDDVISAPNPDWFSNNWGATNYSIIGSGVPGKTYNTWVHSCNSAGCNWVDAAGASVTCPYTITTAANPPGAAQSLTGAGPYQPGAAVTVSTAPNPGWVFTNWTGGPVSPSAAQTYSFSADANRTLTANFSAFTPTLTVTNNRSGTTNVTAAPAGSVAISCGATCSATYAYNTSVTITAPAVPAFSVAISNGCSASGGVGVGASCVVTMDAAKTVNVVYTALAAPVVTVTPRTSNGGATGNAFYGEYNNPGNGWTAYVSWSATNNPTTCTVYRNGVAGTSYLYPAVTQYNLPAAEQIVANTTYRVDCTNAGGTGTGNTVTFIPPPVPTSPTHTCSPDGTQATMSWTLPINPFTSLPYQTNYFRAYDTTVGWACNNTTDRCFNGGNPGGTNDATGNFTSNVSSYTWTVIPGRTISWWVHSRDVNGNWSNSVTDANFVCNPLTYVLTAAKAGTGAGTITGVSAPAQTNINCGVTCNATYTYNTTVNLTATPNAGSNFTSWVGCDSVAGNVCTVTMTAAKNVTATFTLSTNLLTIAKAGTGSGTVTGVSAPAQTNINCGATCNATYTFGTVVTLTATPDVGSVFAGWGGDADCSDGSVTMSVAVNCTATFTLNTYALTVTKVGGAGAATITSNPVGISCNTACAGPASFSFNYNTVVTLTSASSSGYTFTGWSGACSGRGSCVVTMNAAQNVTATYVVDPTVTVTVTPSTVVVPATFRVTMSSTNATVCSYTRTSTYGGDWTNVPTSGVATLNSATAYDSGNISYAAGSATWTFGCMNSAGVVKTANGSVTVTIPDLTISVAPTLNTGTLVAGNSVTFKGTVQNAGSGAVSGTYNNRFQIDLNNDGSVDTTLASVTLANTGVGASSVVVSPAWTATAGTHRIILCADQPVPAITEGDETNNCSASSGPVGVITVADAPPTVTTNAASAVGSNSATLNGSAVPNGTLTTGWFRYSAANPGTCTDIFGTRLPGAGGTGLGSGAVGVAYSQATGAVLAPNTTYYYCALASNAGGTGVGAIASFTTGAAQPDLVIFTNPTLNSGYLVTGSPVTFKGTVGNSGSALAASAFTNVFTIDTNGDNIGDVTLAPNPSIPSLAVAAGQQVISGTWTPAVAGTYKVLLCADAPVSQIAEPNETNNCTDAPTQVTFNVTLNQPPVANAGPNQAITLPTSSVVVDGSASSDPDGAITTYAWSQVSGPNSATIASPAAVSGNISNLIQGVYVFRLTVTDTSGATNSATMQVTVSAAPVDVITLTPISGQLDFGNVGIGGSKTLTITVTNSGGVGSTLIGVASIAVRTTASDAAKFTCLPSCNYNLASGASQNISIKYSPTTIGTNQANVNFTGGGGGTIWVFGNGSSDIVCDNPDSNGGLDFGNVVVGKTKDKVLKIRNSGTTAYGADSIQFSASPPFTCISGCALDLSPGVVNNVMVRFSPTAIQAYNANTYPSLYSSSSFNVSGVGVPATFKFNEQ